MQKKCIIGDKILQKHPGSNPCTGAAAGVDMQFNREIPSF